MDRSVLLLRLGWVWAGLFALAVVGIVLRWRGGDPADAASGFLAVGGAAGLGAVVAFAVCAARPPERGATASLFGFLALVAVAAAALAMTGVATGAPGR